jgi:hypothetical protein
VKAADVKDRKWNIISTGPVRTIVELKYGRWNIGGRSITVGSRITQWAGERGFYQTISTDPKDASEFATGIPSKPGVLPERSSAQNNSGVTWLASWGEQVVQPGPTATVAAVAQGVRRMKRRLFLPSFGAALLGFAWLRPALEHK